MTFSTVTAHGLGTVARLHHVILDNVGNAAGALTTLTSFTLGAGVLAKDSDSIEFNYWGAFTGTDHSNLFVDIDADAGAAFDSGDFDPIGGGWEIHGVITRIDAATINVFASMVTAGKTVCLIGGAQAFDCAAEHTIGVSGLGSIEGDVAINGAFLTLYGAPS